MNLALNLLPAKSTPSQVSSSKSSNSRPKSDAKNSFSDTLDNTVSQSDKATVKEQEQVTAETPKVFVVPNGVLKKNDTATSEQTLADHPGISEGDTTTLEDNTLLDMLDQDVLTNLTNSAVVSQILLAIPAVNMPTGMQSVVLAEQVTAPITAVATGQPQTVAILPEVSVENAVTNSQQNNQTQNTLPDLLQTGQESTEMLAKVSGNPVDQGKSSQTAVGLQNQASQVETLPNLNTPTPPQTVVSMQKQAVTPETIQYANGKTNKQEQQAIEQLVIPTIETNQQARTLSTDLSSGGNKNNLADASMLKVAQELPAEGAEVMNSPVFVQNLDAALLSANGITASAKTTETQSPTTPFADVYQVLDQIVEQTKIITKLQNTEMVMKLKPEHLGELTLKVAIENGVVNASFHSNNPEVRSLLEASLPQLKQDLANTGLKVDNVSVYAGLSQFQPNHDQDRNSRQQLTKFTNKRSSDDFIEAIDGELTGGNIPGMGSQSGVDYRI